VWHGVRYFWLWIALRLRWGYRDEGQALSGGSGSEGAGVLNSGRSKRGPAREDEDPLSKPRIINSDRRHRG